MEKMRDEFLEFWFGPAGSEESREVWFKVDAAFDRTLRDRFGALAEAAAAGALDVWAETADGALALVLLLDQLPRNLNRGTAAAFACDPHARRIARIAVAKGFDLTLPLVRRQFLYLPFEHSEEIADQEESLRLYGALPLCAFRDDVLDWARRHHAVVTHFGRFPHRNDALGRATTEAETEFLKSPQAPY